ncbi:MAG TPA: hypothetical protein VMT22_06960 [Terriglobales bacterium]|nr:hypothetical protein [Terriglobales bacterium]
MVTYISRSCPKCAGLFEIAISSTEQGKGRQMVQGRCLDCGYDLVWIIFLGRKDPVTRLRHPKEINPRLDKKNATR